MHFQTMSLVWLSLTDFGYGGKCYECTWAGQHVTPDKIDEKRAEKKDLEQMTTTIHWIPVNEPYFGTEKVAAYPTNDDLKKECLQCDTSSVSRVCVRWHFFTDASNPKRHTLNVTWGCVRSNQLGCWREPMGDTITKEVCLCNGDLCNSSIATDSCIVLSLLCVSISGLFSTYYH